MVLSYGMGPNKLADKLGITIEEAQELMNKFDKAFPAVTSWLKRAGKQAKLDMKSITQDICKRVRWYPDMQEAKKLRIQAEELESKDKELWKKIMIIEGSTEREGKNHLIQGCAANITKEALSEVRKLVNRYNELHGQVAYLICTVHDQIDCEVKDEFAEEFGKEMEEIMIACGKKYVKKVTIYVDKTQTRYWQK